MVVITCFEVYGAGSAHKIEGIPEGPGEPFPCGVWSAEKIAEDFRSYQYR